MFPLENWGLQIALQKKRGGARVVLKVRFSLLQLSRMWRMLALLTVQHMLPCRCVKIPSFTQTKYAKNLQPMNFGTSLNDVASRNVLSILTHTKSMEMAHVEHCFWHWAQSKRRTQILLWEFLHWSSSFGRFFSQYGSSRRVHEKVQKRMNDDQRIASCDTSCDSCKVILLESDLPNPEAQLCAKDQRIMDKKGRIPEVQ